MTRDKDFKRLVRARASVAGEPYTVAREALLRLGKEARMVPVTCEVIWKKLTEEEVRMLRERQAEAAPQFAQESARISIGVTPSDEQPVLLLTEVGSTRQLPIYCGPFEATAISFAQQGIETERPMTHDLLRDVVDTLGKAQEVRITDLRDKTYFAELVVSDSGGQERAVSCRPSDGIAFAVRAGIPILVAEPLFELGTLSA